MGQTYKILSAEEGRTYTNKHNKETVVWNVTLENAQPENGAAHFELHKLKGNVPESGDLIDVKRLAPGEFNGNPHVRIFLDSNFQGGGSSSSTGGDGGARWTPEKERSIVRQHSQEMALRLIAATGDANDLNLQDTTIVSAYLAGTVKRLTDWFERDATPAGNGAEVVQQPQVNGGGGEVPADTTDLQPAAAAAPGDDSIPF